MNEVIQTLTNHRSYRAYMADKPVSEKDLRTIIHAVQRGASWANGQQVSIIAVKDKETRRKLAELCGNQKHIAEAPVFLAFCADFYRAKLASEREGTPFEARNYTDIVLVGAVDAGIALGNAIAAAESLGLGTVPIGGIRRNPTEIIKLLDLPEYVFPVSGLCIGYPAKKQEPRSRLSQESVYFEGKYDRNLLEKQSFIDDLQSPYGDTTWSKRIANYYGHSTAYVHTGKMLRQQGFHCKDLQEES